jgi:hypothetical protein
MRTNRKAGSGSRSNPSGTPGPSQNSVRAPYPQRPLSFRGGWDMQQGFIPTHRSRLIQRLSCLCFCTITTALFAETSSLPTICEITPPHLRCHARLWPCGSPSPSFKNVLGRIGTICLRSKSTAGHQARPKLERPYERSCVQTLQIVYIRAKMTTVVCTAGSR